MNMALTQNVPSKGGGKKGKRRLGHVQKRGGDRMSKNFVVGIVGVEGQPWKRKKKPDRKAELG